MSETMRPFLMFVGKADEAMAFYISLFPDGAILRLDRRPPDTPGAGQVARATFRVGGQEVMCSDSPVEHAFTFTPSSSLFVECETEARLEALYASLSEGGQVLMPLASYGFSRRFGWVNDRFGVSWQVNLA